MTSDLLGFMNYMMDRLSSVIWNEASMFWLHQLLNKTITITYFLYYIRHQIINIYGK